ncbi:MAG: hypothetical protein MZV64_19185 [Ignavibacteriales bacterium]|nr:hypothetical protein [Ignavibacteriales bacterium]
MVTGRVLHRRHAPGSHPKTDRRSAASSLQDQTRPALVHRAGHPQSPCQKSQ